MTARVRLLETPSTLTQARDRLLSIRPARPASVNTERWIDWYRHCAEVYTQVAKTDTDHHDEALAYAARSSKRAKELKAQSQ
jgi:hypothetical protein